MDLCYFSNTAIRNQLKTSLVFAQQMKLFKCPFESVEKKLYHNQIIGKIALKSKRTFLIFKRVDYCSFLNNVLI